MAAMLSRMFVSFLCLMACLSSAQSGKVAWTLGGIYNSASNLKVSGNGKLLATATGDTELKIWDTATGRLKFTWPKKAATLALSYDGKRLAITTTPSNNVEVYDVSSGNLISSCPVTSGLNETEFNATGDKLYLRSNGIQCLDVATGVVTPVSIPGSFATPWLDGVRDRAGISYNNRYELWDLKTATLIWTVPKQGGLSSDLGYFSSDGSYCAFQTSTNLHVVRLSDGAIVFTKPSANFVYRRLHLSTDGSKLIACTKTSLEIYDVPTQAPLTSYPLAHLATDIAFSDTSDVFYAFESDSSSNYHGLGEYKIWDGAFVRQYRQLNNLLTCISVDDTSEKVFIRAANNQSYRTAFFISGKAGKIVKSLILSGFNSRVELSPDGNSFLDIVVNSNVAVVRDANDGSELYSVLTSFAQTFDEMNFNSSTLVFATRGPTGEVTVWRRSDGVKLWQFVQNEGFDSVQSIALSRLATKMACIADGKVNVYDPTNHTFIYQRTFPSLVRCVALSPDGTKLAVGTAEAVYLLDVASGNTIRTWNNGVGARHLSFDGEGRRLAWAMRVVAGVEVVDTSKDGIWQHYDKNLYLGANAVALAKDGSKLFVARSDATVVAFALPVLAPAHP